MATKAKRLEARLTSTQRRQIEHAAMLAGESVSSFLVLAALNRAESLVRDQASTVLPATHFDRLLASLDTPDASPRLARAVRNATGARKRIKVA